MVSHRSEEFRVRVANVTAGLRPLFGTDVILPFTASGTGGLEAALVNTLGPGKRVLAVQIGYFGDRFAEIARGLDCPILPWSVPWGQAADPEELRRRLRAAAPLDAVLITHNETSTGVLNPLPALAAVVRAESEALILVDGVSSVGAVPVEMDEWGLDVVVTASQKALMSPPGLALVGVGARALAAARENKVRRYYFDFLRMAEAVSEGTTTYTPAISTVYALEAALALIAAEGRDTVFARHRRLAEACRAGMERLGFRGFADPAHASPTVTAILVPEGQSASALRRRLEDEHNVVVSQGRGIWKDQMLRLGHMGYVRSEDITHLIEAAARVVRP
jgi:aspartate aminotransferase-like enzyme